MAKELNLNLSKREVFKHSLSDFQLFVQSLKIKDQESINELIPELEIRVEQMNEQMEEFRDVQFKILQLGDKQQQDEHLNISTEINNIYFRNVGIAKGLLKGKNVVSSDSQPHLNSNQQFKLPTISLIKFDGNCSDWMNFRDTFVSMIHNNPSIDKVNKLYYLKSSLVGDAMKLLVSIELTAENYDIGWDILCKRFNNPRVLANNHVKELFNIERLNKESSNGLRNLIDTLCKNLRALKSLAEPVEHWGTLMNYLAASKLDTKTFRLWEEFKSNVEKPSFIDFENFIISRAEILESFENNASSEKGKSAPALRRSLLVKTSREPEVCKICSQKHPIHKCDVLLKLSPMHRQKKIKDLRLCINCFQPDHYASQCRSKFSCFKCKRKHNTVLHFSTNNSNSNNNQSVDSTASVSNNVEEWNVNNNTHISLANYNVNKHVLLSTVLVMVNDITGRKHACRAILDSASQMNFITENMLKKLAIVKYETNISVVGINNKSSRFKEQCKINIHSRYNDFNVGVSCLIIEKIADSLPHVNLDFSTWKVPSNIQLADPKFNISSEVDLLLGAEVFWGLIIDGTINLGHNLPILKNTKLGWILSGTIPNSVNSLSVNTAQNYFVRHCYFTKETLCKDLENFWKIEELQETNSLTSDEKQCEEHFVKTVSRADNGQFIVKIPLKYPVSYLGDSLQNATKRLLSLEKRFLANQKLKETYTRFIKEYINLGHMFKVNETDIKSEDISYYFPHHAVEKIDSLSTKLRVVFDGSAVTTSGFSFNNLQFVGPTIQSELFEILIKFRKHPIVVCADIEKMYRQVLISEDDQKLHRILWRDTPQEPIVVYQLRTVTYGTTSAPYLAIRCLKQLAEDFKDQYPKATDIINQNFYVDDLIAGFDSKIEASQICQEVSNILESACLKLRKWISNVPEVLNSLQGEDHPLHILNFGDNPNSKTLGIQWNSIGDTLSYQLTEVTNHHPITKRRILSDISKVFDPLGLVSPCIIVAKILIQELWTLKLKWDDKVPFAIERKWKGIRNTLMILNKLNIPRSVICKNVAKLEIHGFSDSSNQAYASCVYIRSIDTERNIHVKLLCAKTRVAPLKVLTIPRLELCGALMLARLFRKISNALDINAEYFLWSDSQVVLCWIKTEASTLQPFVANRISELQNLTNKNNWFYINTKANPADIASRGSTPEILLNSKLWFEGPSFLKSPISEWPNSDFNRKEVQIPELKGSVMNSLVVTTTFNELFERYSSLTKLQRIVAYCLRFVFNSKHSKESQWLGDLSLKELESSMKVLIKMSQSHTFSEEIRILNSKDSLKAKHSLLPLTPFIDSEGILRVGGRLRNANLDYDAKHQILLSGKHRLTQLIFEHEHKKLFHAGPQLLLATVRQTYWPTSGISIAKKITRTCIRCFKFNPKTVPQIMADLPRHRVNINPPFFISGVDYAGPFFVKDRKGRGCKITKAYVCLFICFAVKAVHVELVSDLTTELFVAALKRFCARRGTPQHLYSDNATNFVGANNEFDNLYKFFKSSKREILKACINEKINFHFIPGNSPSFGGIWESNIKCAKFHLKRVVGDTKLTFEELFTILVQVEAILNSRPLHPMSSDPNDLEPITPSHFLIGRSLVAPPDQELIDIPVNHLSRFQLVQQLQQSFWNRWSKIFLSNLQQKGKWKIASQNLKIGDMVVVKNDNLPPFKWLLGRITEVHPGSDGIVRVATVRTSHGTLNRAVNRLCPLPYPSAEQNPE